MAVKAVIFDIGGVVVRSPMLAIAKYEREHGIPPNYINCIIANQGADGAFQKFERGEISLFPFYEDFSRELSSVNGKVWYTEYCERRRIKCPPLPNIVKVDGRELFGRMMRESGIYDDSVVEAIRRIRASGKYRIIALTNNFAKSEDTILAGAPLNADFSVQKELEFLGWQEGPTPFKLRALFDDFCDSSTLGLRKPDPAFYLLACKRNNIRPDEAVFLDDIGYNLKAAQKLGMQTIRVSIDGSLPALERLGHILKLDLINNGPAQAVGTKL
ncbi:epoxide hydrolase [Gautieria morchelliformis]|nr:epoxide hydrolase [Gautieria morchelliformis]